MWQPHWVIAGVHVDDGVVLLASDQLSQVVVNQVAEAVRSGEHQVPGTAKARFHIGGTMLTLTIVHATDFASALKHLFGEWSPDEGGTMPAPPPVGSAQTAITRGRAE